MFMRNVEEEEDRKEQCLSFAAEMLLGFIH